MRIVNRLLPPGEVLAYATRQAQRFNRCRRPRCGRPSA